MSVEFTEQERALLLELIETAERAAILSLDHADTRAFKDVLRRRLKLLSSAKDKLQTAGVRAA